MYDRTKKIDLDKLQRAKNKGVKTCMLKSARAQ